MNKEDTNEKRCIAHQIILELFESGCTGQIQLLLMACALAAKQLDPESFRKFSEHSLACMNADQVATNKSRVFELIKREFKHYCRGRGIDPASVTWKDFPRLDNFQTGAAEPAMPNQGNRQPETANCAPSSFADWYALHGIPLGIGRENAHVIYDAAVKDFAERSDRWFRSIQQELETVKAAFKEVEGQRNSLVIEVGNLRRVIAEHLDSAQKIVGDELPIYCDCGHRKERHDSSIGHCRAAGCDCTAMLQWRPR